MKDRDEMRGEIRHLNPGTGKGAKPPSGQAGRRLAAILIGDIFGYSRLMHQDEDETVARVKRIKRDVLEPTIVEHDGRLVDTAGDGFLAIFDSPVEAVRCGIVIQQSMETRNAMLAREHWIQYRIGINLGDVLFEDDGVYGDGINVAARLEGIAEPGQIYISGGIYEQVKHKVVCGYKSLGDRQVKNITDPVKVYRVLPDPSAVRASRRRPWVTMLLGLAAFALVSALGGGATWYVLTMRSGQVDTVTAPTSTATELAKALPPAAPAPPLAAPQAAPAPAPQAASVAPQAAPIAPQAAPIAPQAAPIGPQAGLIAPPAAAPVAPQREPPVMALVPPVQQQLTAPRLSREPEMVPLPGGSFAMGSNDDATERPVHQVAVKPFAIGKFPVTVREWNECAAAKACAFTATGSDDAPITDVSWDDAKQYTAWLARASGKAYRLPSEAEWEYAARGGKPTKFWWGDQVQPGMANCKNCGDVAGAAQPIKVGSLKPNPFGLYDMGGGVNQWVEDCWHRNYQGAPSDGSAWLERDCSSRVMRSGSWRHDASAVRAASRDRYEPNVRYPTHGFRVALSP
jgi:formylglycine-generating enzyme required for sulfatase activity/class 3 adenylate cyclase